MYLLLGDPQDLCCQGVRFLLERGGYRVQLSANPLAAPWRFSWRLDNEGSISQLALQGEPAEAGSAIDGVLVRNAGWIDPAGWQPDDLAYMQMESRAALLAWLWSLPCPVINRYPPEIWYQPQRPVLAWQSLLDRCGLPTAECVLTNDEQEARLFGQRLARRMAPGAVYGALTSQRRYLLSGEEDWAGLLAMQRYAPVYLSDPHGAVRAACVVEENVVWKGQPSPELSRLEGAMVSLAAAAGLAFVELSFATTSTGLCVVDVQPTPLLENYAPSERQKIVELLANLLTAKDGMDRLARREGRS